MFVATWSIAGALALWWALPIAHGAYLTRGFVGAEGAVVGASNVGLPPDVREVRGSFTAREGDREQWTFTLHAPLGNVTLRFVYSAPDEPVDVLHTVMVQHFGHGSHQQLYLPSSPWLHRKQTKTGAIFA
eukprot:GEMP01126340.1.p1 GENE.GEMP01126340.1~~GEMP01126340.1.p1  ORF type:complete len:130 (+),score=25.56 GEMP01126340.1:15-404(+)